MKRYNTVCMIAAVAGLGIGMYMKYGLKWSFKKRLTVAAPWALVVGQLEYIAYQLDKDESKNVNAFLAKGRKLGSILPPIGK